MTLFVYDWGIITKYDLLNAFTEQKIAYYIFTSKVSPRVNAEKEEFKEELDKAIDGKTFDAVFSVNFIDELAYAAHERGVPYISWCYDSPTLGVVRDSLFFETNYIFLFDSLEYMKYKDDCKVPSIYYLPLATNIGRMDKMHPSHLDKQKYSCDVSFVGRLYNSEMDKIFPLFDEYGAGYIAGLINTQMNVYGKNLIGELVTKRLIDRICNPDATKALIENMNNGFYHDIEELTASNFTGFLLKAVTNKERVLLTTLLAKYCHVKIFTPTNPDLPNVEVHGVVDYVKEMPLVFKCSYINLNITLRLIQRGIPQRVLDIAGCHGLVLTNYQADLQKYFVDGRDILVYNSMEEALDKCKYYLAHNSQAERIRRNGYNIVRNQFSYEHQLNQIWEISGLKSKLEK